MKHTQGELERWVADYISMHNADIAKFAEQLTVNPAYAMENSDTAFTSAATLHVYHRIRRILSDIGNQREDGTVITYDMAHERIKAMLYEEVMNKSKFGSRSTSASTNMMHMELLAAYSRAYDRLFGTGLW